MWSVGERVFSGVLSGDLNGLKRAEEAVLRRLAAGPGLEVDMSTWRA